MGDDSLGKWWKATKRGAKKFRAEMAEFSKARRAVEQLSAWLKEIDPQNEAARRRTTQEFLQLKRTELSKEEFDKMIELIEEAEKEGRL